MQKILVLGISGMLGNAVFRYFSQQQNLTVIGTTRSSTATDYFSEPLKKNIISTVDVENTDRLIKLFSQIKPDVVINCVGLVKQLAAANEVLAAIPINAIFPHRLAQLCEMADARLIHISTDCVFSGKRGNYNEQDGSDAEDVYGKSKYLGEVSYPHTITLRTSIIGRELSSRHGLVNWFLSQENSVKGAVKSAVKGYTRAIFSGLPTIELAQIIHDIVLPNSNLSGVYHVASDPISKYELLKLIAVEYNKRIDIVPDDHLVIDRSLNSARFKNATGYQAPPWKELVRRMHEFG